MKEGKIIVVLLILLFIGLVGYYYNRGIIGGIDKRLVGHWRIIGTLQEMVFTSDGKFEMIRGPLSGNWKIENGELVLYKEGGEMRFEYKIDNSLLLLDFVKGEGSMQPEDLSPGSRLTLAKIVEYPE